MARKYGKFNKKTNYRRISSHHVDFHIWKYLRHGNLNFCWLQRWKIFFILLSSYRDLYDRLSKTKMEIKKWKISCCSSVEQISKKVTQKQRSLSTWNNDIKTMIKNFINAWEFWKHKVPLISLTKKISLFYYSDNLAFTTCIWLCY
jgi:hypothetical protein